MKYDKDILDRFLTEKVAINVETQQEWNEFMKLLESETYCEWSSNINPTMIEDWHWDCYKGYSAIEFGPNIGYNLLYGECSFYENRGYEVIKYKDLIKGDS